MGFSRRASLRLTGFSLRMEKMFDFRFPDSHATLGHHRRKFRAPLWREAWSGMGAKSSASIPQQAVSRRRKYKERWSANADAGAQYGWRIHLPVGQETRGRFAVFSPPCFAELLPFLFN